MALYASNGEDCVFAADADPKASYYCLECHSPVKVRRGIHRFPHFYHLQKSSRCHLYCKSEDHLLIQLQMQKLLSPHQTEIERPFFTIQRIADLVWEKEKIIFEIQCSKLDVLEAKRRIADYENLGYEIVWLLDDRVFNRRFIRPTEEFLRRQSCYFFSFNRSNRSHFYDQLEIIIERKRFRKGFRLQVDLSKPLSKPILEWLQELPSQVRDRVDHSKRYFHGDLLHRALQSAMNPSTALALAKWRQIEIEIEKANQPSAKTYFWKYPCSERHHSSCTESKSSDKGPFRIMTSSRAYSIQELRDLVRGIIIFFRTQE